MRRNSRLIAFAGFAVAVILLPGRRMRCAGWTTVAEQVQGQLVRAADLFPPKAAFAHPVAGTEITPSMIPSVSQYAGQQLLTGQQAEAYADHFIAVHLSELGGGKTWSQLSTEAIAQPTDTALANQVATVRSASCGVGRSGSRCLARIPHRGRFSWWRIHRDQSRRALRSFPRSPGSRSYTVVGLRSCGRSTRDRTVARHTPKRTWRRPESQLPRTSGGEYPIPIYYAGPHPLSEPESRAAVELITRIHPAVTIWYHQHEDLVDMAGGDHGVARRYAHLARLRATCLPFLPGTAIGWSNHAFPASRRLWSSSLRVRHPEGARRAPGCARRRRDGAARRVAVRVRTIGR